MIQSNKPPKGPRMYDLEPYIQAGIDPKTGLPTRLSNLIETVDKADIKRQLQFVDKTDALSRFTYYNLPKGITADLIERIIYYRGQAILFHIGEKHFVLPYALDGTIDMYGRFEEVTPLPFNGSQEDKDNENPWIKGLTFRPMYEVPDFFEYMDKSPEELQEIIDKSCVIIRDHTIDISQTNISRSVMQDSVLNVMSDCIPFMRTALVNSTGVMGMRVDGADEAANVYAASEAINMAALTGQKYVPIEGPVEFQELTGGQVAKGEEFFLAMQSLDNYRLSLYGLDNGGLFQKKSHMLEAEQEMKAGATSLILEDALRCRQEALTIYNAINGTSMWVEYSENVLGMDMNGDGQVGSDDDSTGLSKQSGTTEVTDYDV
jgi:hypothetical protein